jgi:hypothetical protein
MYADSAMFKRANLGGFCNDVVRLRRCATSSGQTSPVLYRLIGLREAQPRRSSPKVSEVWRRERDSNPRNPSGFSGFQDHRHRPLGHLSAPEFSHIHHARDREWGEHDVRPIPCRVTGARPAWVTGSLSPRAALRKSASARRRRRCTRRSCRTTPPGCASGVPEHSG